MNSNLASSLSTFAQNVNTLIPVSQILTIMGIALGAGFSIYLVVWGGKKIISSVQNAIRGYLSYDNVDKAYENPRYAKKFAEKNGFLSFDDYIDYERFDYNSSKEYYDDLYHYDIYGSFKNAKHQAYINDPENFDPYADYSSKQTASNDYWTSEKAYYKYNNVKYKNMKKKNKWARKNGYLSWHDYDQKMRGFIDNTKDDDDFTTDRHKTYRELEGSY